MIVMADYELADQPQAMVFGVDADGLSYVLQPGGAFSVATGDINVVMVRLCMLHHLSFYATACS